MLVENGLKTIGGGISREVWGKEVALILFCVLVVLLSWEVLCVLVF